MSAFAVVFINDRYVADRKLWLHDASSDGRFDIRFDFPDRQYSLGDLISFDISCGQQSWIPEDRIEVWIMSGDTLGPGIAFWASGYVSMWMPGMAAGLDVGQYAVGAVIPVTIKIASNESFMVCIGGNWRGEYPCQFINTTITDLRFSGDGLSGQNIDFYVDDIDLSWTPGIDETFESISISEDFIAAADSWESYPDDRVDGRSISHKVSNMERVLSSVFIPLSILFAFSMFLAVFVSKLFSVLQRGGYIRRLRVIIRGYHVHHWIFAAVGIVASLLATSPFWAIPVAVVHLAISFGVFGGLFLEGITYPDAFIFKVAEHRPFAANKEK